MVLHPISETLLSNLLIRQAFLEQNRNQFKTARFAVLASYPSLVLVNANVVAFLIIKIGNLIMNKTILNILKQGVSKFSIETKSKYFTARLSKPNKMAIQILKQQTSPKRMATYILLQD